MAKIKLLYERSLLNLRKKKPIQFAVRSFSFDLHVSSMIINGLFCSKIFIEGQAFFWVNATLLQLFENIWNNTAVSHALKRTAGVRILKKRKEKKTYFESTLSPPLLFLKLYCWITQSRFWFYSVWSFHLTLRPKIEYYKSSNLSVVLWRALKCRKEFWNIRINLLTVVTYD